MPERAALLAALLLDILTRTSAQCRGKIRE
jgi:hypothetical protein